jgi:hypothetical protein
MVRKLDLWVPALVTGVCRAKPYTVEMPRVLDPFRFVLIAVAGWMNQQQLQMIEYLREENRVLREQLGDRRLCFNDDQRRRLAEVRHAPADLSDFLVLNRGKSYTCNDGFLESRCSVDQPS